VTTIYVMLHQSGEGVGSQMSSEHTEVLTDQGAIMEKVVGIFSRAKRGVDVLAERIASPGSAQAGGTQKAAEAFFDILKRGGRLRILTKIDVDSVGYFRELMKSIEIRHLDEVRGNFAVSESEYISSQGSAVFMPDVITLVIYSNSGSLVAQNANVFETLWSVAEPAAERIREIEQGFDQARTEVIRDVGVTRRQYLDLLGEAKEEILLIMPTANAFRRQESIGVIDAAQAASERGVRVSIMSPNSSVEESIREVSGKVEAKVGRRLMSHRSIPQADSQISVTVVVVDRKTSLVIEQKDDSQPTFEGANGAATRSTRNSTVLANIRFFERMWQEVELIQRAEDANARERQSRKTAELLQDILSHDIRNYNQISMTSAELLRANLQEDAQILKQATGLLGGFGNADRLTGRSEKVRRLGEYLRQSAKSRTDAEKLIDAIIKAVDGSSNLIERAKKLGSIVSLDDVQLRPVDLEVSMRRSIELVSDAHPERSIKMSFRAVPGAKVQADDMLEEVFINLLSNSVNYTEKVAVPVEIKVEAATIEGKEGEYWKLAFIDHGKGIPDDVKGKVFERYHRTASGKGLGLSIVYALAVERYSGKLLIKDRVEGDHTKGTRIELWLPKAL